MRIRLTLIAGCFAAALTGYYLSSPFIAAHKLREAVKAGETDKIERMIEWPSFRASLKETIARNAQLLPLAVRAGQNIRPTIWQRLRSVFGHSMLDRFMERYITANGLTKLYHAKTRWHAMRRPYRPVDGTGRVIKANLDAGAIVPAKLLAAWRRIKKAEFTNPFRFVLEMQDRHVPTRLIRATFQLSNISFRGIDWKLTTVSIRQINPSNAHLAHLNGF